MGKVKIFYMIIVNLIFFTALANTVFSTENQFKPGIFYLEGVREVGSVLTIKDNGKFEYFLSYGAYDEQAEGNWLFKDGNLILNSNTPDIPPKFSLKENIQKNEGEYTVMVQDKMGNGIPGIDVIVYFKGKKSEIGYTQYYGYKFSSSEPPLNIGLKIDMYRVPEQVFQINNQKADNFIFEFDPGNLGLKHFNNTKLLFKDDSLILLQEGMELRYVRQKLTDK